MYNKCCYNVCNSRINGSYIKFFGDDAREASTSYPPRWKKLYDERSE